MRTCMHIIMFSIKKKLKKDPACDGNLHITSLLIKRKTLHLMVI